MNVIKTRVFQLLEKLTQDSLTDQEYEELTDYIKRSETDSIIYEYMDSFWFSQDVSESFTKHQAKEVYQRIVETPAFKPKHFSFNFVSTIGRLKIAASVLIFSVMFLGGYKLYHAKSDKSTQFVQYSAGTKQLFKKLLPDGSTVWMNAGSNIRFLGNLDQGTRDIYLSGEAYFDVSHNPERPFIVHTGGVSTRVLGTAFNVNAYSEGRVQVTVARGKVSVSEGKDRLGLLTANRQLSYNILTKQVEEKIVESSTVAAWIGGELMFNDITLLEASEIISRWYNVKFIFKNQNLKNCRFVMSFKNSVPINQVMDVLSQLNNFEYSINDEEIVVNTSECQCQ